MQVVYDEAALALCHMAASNAWDKVEETGKGLEPLTQIMQGSKETFTEFLQRLTSAIQRSISDPHAKKALTETLAFENANSECKRQDQHQQKNELEIQLALNIIHIIQFYQDK